MSDTIAESIATVRRIVASVRDTLWRADFEAEVDQGWPRQWDDPVADLGIAIDVLDGMQRDSQAVRRVSLSGGRTVLVDSDDEHTDEEIRAALEDEP